MLITRFFTTPEKGSQFADIEIPLPDSSEDAFGHVLHRSRAIAAECVLVSLPAGLAQGWHNAPNRQLVAVLQGRLEVETSAGDKRQWRAGGLFMADDTTGQGHRTRVIEGPAQLLFVRLPDDFDLDMWVRR